MRACSALLILLIAAPAIAAFGNPAVEPVPRSHKGWESRHEATTRAVKETTPRLVFIGDSITHFYESTGKSVWEKEYAVYGAANLGIAGDRTQHVLWRIERALPGSTPDVVVIQIGTNNLTVDRQADFVENTAEEIAAGVLAVVRTVRELVPEARILLLGLFPRADIEPQKAAGVHQVNELLARAELDGNTTFMDIGEIFLDSDGAVNKQMMWDRLHLTKNGYQRWADAIRDEIVRSLGG